MKVLVLSCNTGEGHNSAGKAVAECVMKNGHEAKVLDIMMLAGQRTSRLVGGGYVGLVKHAPHMFQFLYKAGETISSEKRKSPVYYANTLMAKKLEEYLRQHPCDVIVTPHLFPAETLTYMKKKGKLSQKVVAVGTDYTCIPFWEETDCDYYVIPHKDLAKEYIDRGIPAEKLLPYGIPVQQKFLGAKDKERAKKRIHLTGGPAYLIMSGSMGFGKIQLFVAELLKNCRKEEQIVIICGKNKKLAGILKSEFGRRENVRICGYTQNVPIYMDACDVIFTKPGGLTTTEAAVRNIAMVHTAPIPGCETKNMNFFNSRGMSVAAGKIREQVEAGQILARDAHTRERMLEAQRREINPNAGEDIVKLLLRISSGR